MSFNGKMSSSCHSSLASSNGDFKQPNCYLQCPECCFNFDYIRRTKGNISRIPLILPCKHNICEDCIRRKYSNHVECPICREIWERPREYLDRLNELFPPHFALIGFISWQKNRDTSTRPIRSGAFVSTGITLKNRQLIDMEDDESSPATPASLDSQDEMDQVILPVLKFDKCSQHKDFLNIHCVNCSQDVCCYCFVENHTSHQANHLYKLDDSEMDNFNMYKKQAVSVLHQLNLTKQKISDLKKFTTSKTEMEISKYFFNLHAQFTWIEKNLKQQLLTVKYENGDLNSFKNDIKSKVNYIEHLLETFNFVEKKQVNMKLFKEHLEAIGTIPCTINGDHNGDFDPINFNVKTDYFDNLEDIFTLSNGISSFNLIPIKDLNEHLTSEEEVVVQEKCDTSVEGITYRHSICSDRSGMSENSLTDKYEKVSMTHLNNLNSFYVQFSNKRFKLDRLEKKMSKEIVNCPLVEKPICGKLYACLYIVKNFQGWRRGTILNIVNEDNNDSYNVFFIDYGNSHLVKKSNIRQLKSNINTAPFAIECKLYDQNNILWEKNTYLHLPEIITDKQLYLKQIRILPVNLHEVELFILNSNREYKSVINILSTLYGNSSDEQDTAKQQISTFHLFENSKVFTKGQMEDVVVTHVIDPFNIYVQLSQNMEIMSKMMSNLTKFYNSNNYELFCIPTEGNSFVVNYTYKNYGNWFRVRVIKVNINKTATVFFVDYGETLTLPFKHFRILTQNFIKIECQAIHIKLSDIEPMNKNKDWPAESINFLIKQIYDKVANYKMLINKVQPLEATLFQVISMIDFCINGLLVEEKLAFSTGNMSKVTCWPQNETTNELENDTLCTHMIRKTEEIMINDEEVDVKSALLKQIDIVHCENPDLIYFKFKQMDELIDNFNKEFQIFYADEKKSKTKWNIDEFCVVFDKEMNNYKRGIIKEKINSKSFLVRLYDDCKEKIITTDSLYVYDDYFRNKKFQIVYKCHIANIKPAGGTDKWANLAIEMLKEIFKTYKKIFINKTVSKSDIPKNSMPVKMWYCLTTPGDALQPSKINFISINKTIIESGLGLSVQQNELKEQEEVDDLKDEDVNVPKEESNVNVEDVTESNKRKVANESPISDWYELVETEKEAEKLAERVDMSVPVEIEEFKCERWPDLLPLKKLEFDAVMVCVESDGHIMLRDVEMDTFYYDMEKEMKKYFDTVDFSGSASCNYQWKIGRMCTIKYNDSYYRGIILDVLNKKLINCFMIDFGSDHIINKNKLHWQIMYPDLPPFINRCKLYDVVPKNGEWSCDDIDIVMNFMCKTGRVVVKNNLSNEIPQVEIFNDFGESMNDKIVEICSNLIRLHKKSFNNSNCSQNDIVNENEVVESVLEKYIFESLPESDKKIQMTIINVLKYDQVVLNILNCESIMNSLIEDIQRNAEKQSPITKIELNKPCVCKNTNQNNIWCRALIYNTDCVSFGYVMVFYVDLGILDTVSVNNLKMMQSNWFLVPVYNYIAKINIQLSDKSLCDHVLTHMNNLCGKTKLVEILKENPLIVNLYDDNDHFSYENLIKSGILQI